MEVRSRLLPLTTGLAVSAAMRADHSTFAPHFPGSPIEDMLGSTAERLARSLEVVAEAYDAAEAGRECDGQLLEELTGGGFYRPELEAGYAANLTDEGLKAMVAAVVTPRSAAR